MAGNGSPACCALLCHLPLGAGPLPPWRVEKRSWGTPWCQGWLYGNGEQGEAGSANTSWCMSRDSPPLSPPAPASPLAVSIGQALSASDYFSGWTWLQAPHSFQPSTALSQRQALHASAIVWGWGQGQAWRRRFCWLREPHWCLRTKCGFP